MLSQLSEFIVAQLGLHFPPERWADLERSLLAAATDFGFRNGNEFSRWLLTAPLTKPQIGKLASHLTVGETYFFREPRSYEILESDILVKLIQTRRNGERRLRLWSAACATGEEAYSLAITISRAIPDLENWNVTILATDINPLFLQKAMTGTYTGWSFRNTPEWIKNYYFDKQANGRYAIIPRIKRMVTFAPLNLVEDVYPSLLNNTNAMDIIFCRNVLMYFAPEQINRVINQLYNSLVNEGWLITSPAEVSHRIFTRFETVNFSGATFYRRDDSPSQPATKENYMKPSFDFAEMFAEQPKRNEPLPPPVETPAPVPESKLTESLTFDMANALYEQGDNQAAEETLKQLLIGRPEEGRSLLLLARAQANQGKLQDAYNSCQRAIVADRLNPKCYYLLAIIAGELGLMPEAGQAFRQALYLDTDFIVAHYAVGILAMNQGKQTEAARHFATALNLLGRCSTEDLLPEGDGLTAGRLSAIIRAVSEGNR